tara:strand:- start:208 stop:468 length:261 start_codon:yes stop_codon:yes gene_type:complete
MNNTCCILGAILIIILILGLTNFRQNEGFLVGNGGFRLNSPNPLVEDLNEETETPIRDRIVYEGASTPFTPVGTVLSNNTGSFVYE